MVFDTLYAGHLFGRYAHGSRLLLGFDDSPQVNNTINHHNVLCGRRPTMTSKLEYHCIANRLIRI